MSLSTTCWGGGSGVSMVPVSAPSAPTCRCRIILTGPLMVYSQSPASEAAPFPAFFCSASAAVQSANPAQISIKRAARTIARSIIAGVRAQELDRVHVVVEVMNLLRLFTDGGSHYQPQRCMRPHALLTEFYR